MKVVRNIFFIILGVLLISPMAMADVSDFNEELIEADAIGADSEAALIEAEELKEELAEERKEAEKMKQELAREKEAATLRRRQAEKSIARTEKQLADVKAKTQGYKMQSKALKKKMAATQAKLDKVSAELEDARAREDAAKTEKNHSEKELAAANKQHRNMRRKAKQTAVRINTIIKSTNHARGKLSRTVRNMKKDSDAYRAMIEKYRKNLDKATRMLNELEMAIEVDLAYDQRMADLGKPLKGRTVSGLNKTKTASVSTKKCNLRSYPSTKAEVLGSIPKGKQVKLKTHSKSWYTVVYAGEKAFMGKSCFNL